MNTHAHTKAINMTKDTAAEPSGSVPWMARLEEILRIDFWPGAVSDLAKFVSCSFE
jgi:hypothetical protein